MTIKHSTFKCLYKILNVSPTSTRQQIRSSYAELAKLYHPDAGMHADSTKFSEISEAYRVLSDPQLRQKYDLKRAFAVGDSDIDLSDVGIGEKKGPSQAKWDLDQWSNFLKETEAERKKKTSYEGTVSSVYMTALGIGGFIAGIAYLWYYVNEANNNQKKLETYYNSGYGTNSKIIDDSDVIKNQSLIPSRFKKFEIIKREQLTPDTFMLRIDLGGKDAVSGLGITSCILIRDNINPVQQLTRAYTPVSEPGQQGYMDVVIKDAGRLSGALSRKKVGDSIWIKGPIRKFYYGGPGTLTSISMIAGGSGITPHYQLLRVILNDPKDKTPIYMLYASKSTDDIILKNELDELAKKHPDQFHLTYVVDKVNDDVTEEEWANKGHIVGRINDELILERLHSPGTINGKVFICGPGSLIEYLIGHFTNYDLYNIYTKSQMQNNRGITGALGKLGYASNSVYEF